jgi:hypothetical protein
VGRKSARLVYVKPKHNCLIKANRAQNASLRPKARKEEFFRLFYFSYYLDARYNKL